MKEFIGFIAIIISLLLLLLLAFGLLRVALITLPACTVAISVMLLVLYLFRAQRVHYLNSHGALSRILVVQFEGHKLHWELEESQIASYAKARLATFFSIILGITSIWVILSFTYKKGAFNNLTRLSSDANMIIGYILSGIVIIITIIKAKPAETLKDAIWDRGSSLVNQINTQLERIHELGSLETSIQSLAYQLKISFPADFKTAIQEFVCAHKNELLSDTTGLNNLIAAQIKHAEEDRMYLEKANNHYRAAMKLYMVVAVEVNWTGSIPLIKEMEYDYEGLTSENMKSLLSERKWDDFHDIVQEIMKDLQQLRELARKYQEEGTPDNKKETDEEKAYRLMEISPAASNEEIKKAYRDLALNYHPDNAEQTTLGIKKLAEDHFKEINWAYDFLKQIRSL